MAQGFKLDIDNEFAEFAGEFVKHLGVELPRNMILAGQALWNSLFESTSDNLHKHPTGTLKRGWTVGPLKVGNNGYKVDVFNRVPYAAIHETGGVIRPKRVKALAVPNRSYRPIMRNNAAIAPREYDPGRTRLKFYPAIMPGKVRGYLVDKTTGELAYTLMAHVRIKPTSYVTEAIENAMPAVLEITGGALVTAMGKAE
jgi:hypothetical protein